MSLCEREISFNLAQVRSCYCKIIRKLAFSRTDCISMPTQMQANATYVTGYQRNSINY